MRTSDRHGAAAEHFDYLAVGPEIDGDDDADATGGDAAADHASTSGDAPAGAQPPTATSTPSRA